MIPSNVSVKCNIENRMYNPVAKTIIGISKGRQKKLNGTKRIFFDAIDIQSADGTPITKAKDADEIEIITLVSIALVQEESFKNA